MDIEIIGYRVLYSKSIAGRGIARFIRWLGTAGPVDYFIIEYLKSIDLFQFVLVGYRPPLVMPLPQGTQLIFTSMIALVTFLLQFIGYPLPLMKQTSLMDAEHCTAKVLQTGE